MLTFIATALGRIHRHGISTGRTITTETARTDPLWGQEDLIYGTFSYDAHAGAQGTAATTTRIVTKDLPGTAQQAARQEARGTVLADRCHVRGGVGVPVMTDRYCIATRRGVCASHAGVRTTPSTTRDARRSGGHKPMAPTVCIDTRPVTVATWTTTWVPTSLGKGPAKGLGTTARSLRRLYELRTPGAERLAFAWQRAHIYRRNHTTSTEAYCQRIRTACGLGAGAAPL